MFFRVLLLGLVLIPFYELFLYLLMPGAKVPEWIDMRVTKEYLAVGLATTLTIVSWKKSKSLNCPNFWILAFVGFLFLNLSKTPIAVTNPIIEVARMGSFPGEFKVLIFFLFFCSMTTVNIGKRQMEIIFKTIYLSGVVMAVYMIIQALKLDQIYRPLSSVEIGQVKSPAVAGFFGQPTLSVPFLCLTIPFAVYFKKWIGVIVIAIGTLLTGSDFAIICLMVLTLVYSVKNRWLLLVAFASSLPVIYMMIKKTAHFFDFNGRLAVWGQILQDVFTGTINGVTAHIGMTGAGFSNFGVVFTALHQLPWSFAHNEYLHILWTCGCLGLAIFLMIHFDILKTIWQCRKSPEVIVLSMALLMLCVCACGTFVWQLGVYQFYTVVIVGLIYQIKKRLSNDLNTAN